MGFEKYLLEGITIPFRDIKFLIMLMSIIVGWAVGVITGIEWFMLLIPIIAFIIICYYDYRKKLKGA